MNTRAAQSWRLSPERRLARLRNAALPPSDDSCRRQVIARLGELVAIAKQDRSEYEGDPRDPQFPVRRYVAETAHLAANKLHEWIHEIGRASPQSRIRKEALAFLVQRDAAPNRRPKPKDKVPTTRQVENAWEHEERIHPAGEAARQLLSGDRKAGDGTAWRDEVVAMLRRGEALPLDDSRAVAALLDGETASHADGGSKESNHQAMVEEYRDLRSEALGLYIAELRRLQKEARVPLYIEGDWIPSPVEMSDPRRGQPITVRAPHLLWIDSVIATERFPDVRAARAHLNRREHHYVAEFSRATCQ